MSDVTYWFNIWNRKLRLLTVSRRKDSNSWGPILRRLTKSGIFSRVSFRKGKINESCKQEDAEDAKKKRKKNPHKCSEILCCESCWQGSGSEVHSLKCSLGLRLRLERYTRQETMGLIGDTRLTIMRRIVVFGDWLIFCKSPCQTLLGNFLFSLIHHLIMLKGNIYK